MVLVLHAANYFDPSFIMSPLSSQAFVYILSVTVSGCSIYLVILDSSFQCGPMSYMLALFNINADTLCLCSPVHPLPLIYFMFYSLWTFVYAFCFYFLFQTHSSIQCNLSSDSTTSVRLFLLRSPRHFPGTSLPRNLTSISNNLSKIAIINAFPKPIRLWSSWIVPSQSQFLKPQN